MTNKKISNFEFGVLNFLITRALLIGVTFNALINIVKQDSWIIPILSIIPSIILIFLIKYIMDYEPDLDLPHKLIKLFNKKIGIILIIIFTILFFFMFILNFLNLNNFIQSQFLNKTPFLAISIMFMIAIYYIFNKGIHVICRTSTILFYISIILFALSFTGLLPQVKIDNIKPIFTSSTLDYVKGLNTFYSFNIMPMLLLTIIPKKNIENVKLKKTLIISYIFSAFTTFCIVFQTLAVFGYELSNIYEYPQFLVLKHVTIVGLSSRIESILIMQVLFDIFILCIIIVYFMDKIVKSFIKTNKTNLVSLIICLILTITTVYVSKYNIYLDNLMIDIIPITLSILSILITLIICIKIKTSKI